jgi:hypothetical protein
MIKKILIIIAFLVGFAAILYANGFVAVIGNTQNVEIFAFDGSHSQPLNFAILGVAFGFPDKEGIIIAKCKYSLRENKMYYITKSGIYIMHNDLKCT